MNLNQLQPEENHPTTHVTDAEARAVVELWASRTPESQAQTPGSSIRDIAEALAIPTTEAESLLREVRNNAAMQRQAAEEAEQRKREQEQLQAEENIRLAELRRRQLEAETAALAAQRRLREEKERQPYEDHSHSTYKRPTPTTDTINDATYVKTTAEESIDYVALKTFAWIIGIIMVIAIIVSFGSPSHWHPGMSYSSASWQVGPNDELTHVTVDGQRLSPDEAKKFSEEQKRQNTERAQIYKQNEEAVKHKSNSGVNDSTDSAGPPSTISNPPPITP